MCCGCRLLGSLSPFLAVQPRVPLTGRASAEQNGAEVPPLDGHPDHLALEVLDLGQVHEVREGLGLGDAEVGLLLDADAHDADPKGQEAPRP